MRALATALLLCCAAVAVPAADAASAAPRVAEFGIAVPATGGAHAAAAARVTTRVLRPGRRFDLVGLRWRSSAQAPDAALRVLRHGRWSGWVPLDGADAGGHGTDPVWVGGADALQLRHRPGVRGLRVRFVRVTHRVRPKPRARASQAGRPPIVARAEWDPGNQCRPRANPYYGAVQMAFVHHTVSVNEYAPEDSAAIVLSICKYHRDTNGWNDLGYNFLVDRYGRLFEGRSGGIDKPVVGAQAQGFNRQSTSVSNIGTYTDVPQSDAALGAMAALLAWKLPLHGVPVTGSVTLTSGGGAENRYPSGTPVSFERISGHRDGGHTACPGDALYAQLPQLRELARSRAPFPVAPAPIVPVAGEITATAVSTALVYPEPLQLTGRLHGDGRVSVQVQSGTAWTTIARADPTDGAWLASAKLAAGRKVRAIQVLPDGRLGAVSGTFAVSVAPALTAHAARRVRAGGAVLLRGAIAPRKAKLEAVVAIQAKSGRLARVRALAVRARGGAYAIRVPLRKPGLYRLKVRFGGDAATKPAYAPDVWVRAVKRVRAVSGGAEARAAR